MAGLPWIPLDVAFPTSRKAVALGIALQEPLSWAYVVRLWTWCATHAADGRIEGPDAVAVLEHAAGWTSRPGELARAMSLPHIRLLDETSSGFAVHDWDDHCGAHVEKRHKERARLKSYRDRTRTERVRNPYVRGERERESNTEIGNERIPTSTVSSSVGRGTGRGKRQQKTGDEAQPDDLVVALSPDEWRARQEQRLASKFGGAS